MGTGAGATLMGRGNSLFQLFTRRFSKLKRLFALPPFFGYHGAMLSLLRVTNPFNLLFFFTIQNAGLSFMLLVESPVRPAAENWYSEKNRLLLRARDPQPAAGKCSQSMHQSR